MRSMIHHLIRHRWMITGRGYGRLVSIIAVLLALGSALLLTTSARAAGGPWQRHFGGAQQHAGQVVSGPFCHGHGCDRGNPYTTRCAGQSWDSWGVLLSTPIKDTGGRIGGYVQLWWSATCQTNWVRTVSTSGHPSDIVAALTDLTTGTFVDTDLGPGAPQETISPQLFMPTDPAFAYGGIMGPDGDTYSGIVRQ